MWMLHKKFKRNVFQVMEKAEHLRDAGANILPAFLRLQELVRKCGSHFVFVLKIRMFYLLNFFLLCVDDKEEAEAPF